MERRELSVPGAWELTPTIHADERGLFLEAFTDTSFQEFTGHRFSLAQMSLSVSAEGVLRGLHFATVPPGQAKYVLCPKGTVFDVVVDIRWGSPTFGEWAGVLLDDVDRRAVYLPEGLAHGFLSLEPESTVMYLCSEGWRPGSEHTIDPFDPKLAIEWPSTTLAGTVVEPIMSPKDLNAPSLLDVAASGVLPHFADCEAYIERLRRPHSF